MLMYQTGKPVWQAKLTLRLNLFFLQHDSTLALTYEDLNCIF